MRRTLATVGGLGLAVAFSQFPEYAQQYEQRLGGAVDELRAITEDFDADAQRFGLTREEALQRYAVSPDSFLIGRGVSMRSTLARYNSLSSNLAELQSAGPLQRVQHLGDYLDSEIGAKALATYKPAVPVTAEGVTWALAGLVAGYVVFSTFIGFITLPFRWRNGHLPHRRVPLGRRRRIEAVTDTVTVAEVNDGRERTRRAVAQQRQG